MKSAFPKQEWTDHALETVEKSALSATTPKDAMEWFGVTEPTNEHWVHLLAAMCKYESNFNPNTTYAESGNLAGVISAGLFQVSKVSVSAYGFPGLTTNQLKEPLLNIEIAVAILEKWVWQDELITSKKSPWRGGARYWSVLRGSKSFDTKATLKTYLEKYASTEPVETYRFLEMGMAGEDVLKLQNKLIELGWLKAVINGRKQNDGFYGRNTRAAVISFQRANGLGIDGIAGPITQKALYTGTIPVEPPPVETDTLPPVPESRAQIVQIFGANVEGGSDAWESQNLKFCEVPSVFTEFPLRNGKRGFSCHKKLIPAFQAVFNEIHAQGLWDDEFYSFDGCYNPRKITGGSQLSYHAYGIAIDINYKGNEYGDSTPAMDRRIVAIFKKYNFRWGGNYSGTKDGMHFEYFKD